MRWPRAAHALLGLGAFAVATQAGGSGPQPRALPRLDAELAAVVTDPAHPLASLSVLAIRDGRVVYHRQFGHAWIDNANPARSKPAGETTLYRIASITKLVVALGVMRLVEQGVLDLDRDVSESLGFVLRNPHFPETPITLRMLLAHTSSLRDDAGYYWTEGQPIREVFRAGSPLHGNGAMWARERPGTFFTYANLPSGLIGTLMERATGERFDRLMQRLVLDPLGMCGGFSPAHMSPERVASIATLYRKRSEVRGREVWDPAGPWVAQVDDYSVAAPVSRATPHYEIGSNGTLFGPAGNLRASAADLGRVMRMLMDRGEIDGRRFLAADTVDLMLSRQARSAHGNPDFGGQKEKFIAWGLGNQHFVDVGGAGRGDRLVEGGGFTGVGHHGDAWGLTGILAFNRERRDGFVFLMGGPGFDPHTARGAYSSFYRYEERIMTALHRHAISASALGEGRDDGAR